MVFPIKRPAYCAPLYFLWFFLFLPLLLGSSHVRAAEFKQHCWHAQHIFLWGLKQHRVYFTFPREKQWFRERERKGKEPNKNISGTWSPWQQLSGNRGALTIKLAQSTNEEIGSGLKGRKEVKEKRKNLHKNRGKEVTLVCLSAEPSWSCFNHLQPNKAD